MIAREYPHSPLVGVGVVVFNEQNKILLVQRGQDPNKGLWALPGGLVELGEELKIAAGREVKEKCDIDVAVGEPVSIADLILKDPDNKVKYHYILINYSAMYISGIVQPQTDVNNADWFSQADVDKLDIPELTKNVIYKAFKSSDK